MAAAFDTGSDADKFFSCPSDNCTWPTYVSLGVCSNFRDLTAFVQTHTDCRTGLSQPFQENVTTCNYEMPIQRNGEVSVSGDYNSYDHTQNRTATSTNAEILIDGYVSISGVYASFPIFSTYGIKSSLSSEKTPYETPFYLDNETFIPSKISLLGLLRTTPDTGSVEKAHLCALSFCVRRYNDKVDRTVLSSEVLDIAYSAISGTYESLHSYNFTNGNETLNYTPSWDVTDSYHFEEYLDNAFIQMLQGNVSGATNVINGISIPPTASSQLMFAFSNSKDIPTTMDSIATAISNHMRTTSNTTVSGQAGSIEAYIQVRWAWLALPGALIVIGMASLVFAITETKKYGSHVWKSSEIALLFHGIQPPIPQTSSMNTAREMEYWSKDVKVKLLHDSNDSVTLRRNV
ncbi:MAG: hypothetical protein Q9195_007298 [Heterodermia aff. obscurata]